MISNDELFALLRKNPVRVGAIALSLGLGAAIYLRADAVPANQALLEQKAVEGRRLALNVKNATQLSDQLATLSNATSQISPRLVSADELAKNLQYFYKFEAETGVKLIDLRQAGAGGGGGAAKVASGPVPVVVFNLSLQGEYSQILEFLRRLENGRHYSRTTSATLGVPSLDRSGPMTLQLTVEFLSRP